MDDCWSLDLKRLESWSTVLPGTMSEQIWKGDVSDTDASSDEEEEEDFDSETELLAMEEAEDEDENSVSQKEKEKKKKKPKKKESTKAKRSALKEEIQKLQEELNLGDPNRTPAAGENLRDFFGRTTMYWSEQVCMVTCETKGHHSLMSMIGDGRSREGAVFYQRIET